MILLSRQRALRSVRRLRGGRIGQMHDCLLRAVSRVGIVPLFCEPTAAASTWRGKGRIRISSAV